MSSTMCKTHSDTSISTDSRPARVLIVDDIPVERRFAGGLAERVSNLKAVYAANGSEAMEVIERESPVVVLTDLQMPVMDGLRLVEEIRSKYPELPVILMTAHGSETFAVEALRRGAASYVPKRDLARQLSSTLTQILEAADAGNRRRRLFGFLEAWEASYCLENDPDMVAEIIGLIRDEMCRMGFGDVATRLRLTVALQEALSNALYHGNLEVSSDLRQDDEELFYNLAESRRGLDPYRNRRIRIDARLRMGEARFVIRDEGPGFDTSWLDRPIDPEDTVRIGGRGLLLIRAFMDEVAYNEAGNQVAMVKKLIGPEDEPFKEFME